MPDCDGLRLRLAERADAEAIGRLLHEFNREFDEPTPGPSALAERVRELLDGGDTAVLLTTHGAHGPHGVAVLRFRLSIWDAGLECYLAELYVVPDQRGRGLGRALMQAALQQARARSATTMDISVDEPDAAPDTCTKASASATGQAVPAR